jgi:hypothetical protein
MRANQISTKKQGGYYSYLNSFLSQIPIIVLDKEGQKPFVQRTNELISYKTKIEAERTELLNKLNRQFPDVNLNRKIQNFEKFDFNAFLSELEKSNNDDLDDGQISDWKTFFNSKKSSIEKLSLLVDDIQDDIDSRVFDLYGLSEQQKKLIISKYEV